MNLPNIDCIGELEGTDILDMSGFALSQNSGGEFCIPDLDDKVICDFGSGASDFLETVKRVSSPERLVAIDPMYQSEKFFETYVQRTLDYNRERISDALSLLRGDNSEYNRYQLNNIRRRTRILESATLEGDSIEKCTSLEKGFLPGTFDYIFVNNTFFYFANKEELLAILGMFLKDTGVIIINDYIAFANDETKKFFEKYLGVQGIEMIGSKHFNGSFRITRNGAGIPYLSNLT